MRGFWHTIALIAENAGTFNKGLFAVCKSVNDPDLLKSVNLTSNPSDKRKLQLKKQPTQNTLLALDKHLRTRCGLVLFPYELAELNRIVCEAAATPVPHTELKKFWTGLGKLGKDNRNHAGFMEAVGALASDAWAINQFVANGVSLTPWFHLTPAQETGLRAAMPVGGATYQAAEDYRDTSWPGGSCGSILMPSDNWTHMNV